MVIYRFAVHKLVYPSQLQPGDVTSEHGEGTLRVVITTSITGTGEVISHSVLVDGRGVVLEVHQVTHRGDNTVRVFGRCEDLQVKEFFEV